MKNTNKLVVSYSTIENVLTTIPSYYIQKGDGGYDLFSIAENYNIYCSLLSTDTAYISDFENNHKTNCTSVESPDDAILLGTLANKIPLVVPKDPNGIPLISQQPRVGTEFIAVSNNLCDPTTWYASSTRITEELTDSGDGYRFNSSNTNWIDMITGRVHGDDDVALAQEGQNPNDMHGYQVEVYIDGYIASICPIFTKTSGDYWISYEDGYVVFLNNQSGKTITASYSYSTTSEFVLEPKAGEAFDIEYSEADFSTDVEMTDAIEYNIYGYVDVFAPQLMPGIPSGTQIPIVKYKYKRFAQLLAEAVGAFPAVAPAGSTAEERALSMKDFRQSSRGTKSDAISVPFRYGTVRTLSSAAGMKLVMKLEHDTPFNGETGTITFYGTVRKE